MMMNDYIDLHVHSTASDGSFTPSELVHLAAKKNLVAFALTDHDTTAGISEALLAADEYNRSLDSTDASTHPITVIPGIEISTGFQGEDIHVLGYNIHYNDISLLDELEHLRNVRTQRNVKMLSLLRDSGFPFTDELINKRFGSDTVITRAHYAILLVEMGYCKDKNEAFQKYLGHGCPCYVPRTMISPMEAVRIIRRAGGHPVLAHPVLYKIASSIDNEEFHQLIDDMIACGLEGIEAIYCLNTPEDDIRFLEFANSKGLFITGGSDFHGDAKPGLELGTGYNHSLRIPASILHSIT